MSDFASLSDSFAAAVDAVAPSVIRVQSGRRLASGLAWSTDTALTVASALSRRGETTVVLADGTELPATVVGVDRTTDVALLSVEGELPVAPRSHQAPRVGHLVLALGRPGAGVRAASGLVSGVGGPWKTHRGGRVDAYIDVDGGLPAGFPGGPLVDAWGRVLGLNSRGLVPGGTTVPVSTLERVATHIREHGSVVRGWLGVGFQSVDVPGVDRSAAEQARGLLVHHVRAGSPAELAGVKVGDLLLRVGGAPTTTFGELRAAMEGRSGKATDVALLRGGSVQELQATPSEPRRC